jgi:hypothetical protein
MKQTQLKELLERYYNALTTPDEEQLLYELLSSEDLPPEFYNERVTLLTIIGMSALHEPDPLFESRMESVLFSGANASIQQPAAKKHGYRKLFLSVMSSAAVVILAVAAWFMIGRESEPADTFSSPELAYEETIRALHNVSSAMNRATSKLKPLESVSVVERSMQNVEEVGRLIDHGFSGLESVQKTLTGKEITNRETYK